MGKKLTTEEWIKKISIRREDKGLFYNYSKTIYINQRTNVEIICPLHGSKWVNPHDHYNGTNCYDCGRLKVGNTKIFHSARHVKSEFQQVHGSIYDYSNIVDFYGHNKKLEIICRVHGAFVQYYGVHKSGSGCPTCGKLKSDKAGEYSTEEWIKRAIQAQGNVYDYSESTYIGAQNPIDIICPKHGVYTQARAFTHLRGAGCTFCRTDKISEAISGNKHWKYKDGKTKERARERLTPENYQWLKLIKEDKTQCDCCKEHFEEYNIPHAHHLNSWIDHPDERHNINNGVAICGDCHWEFHNKYGWGYNTKEQYYQFRQLKQLEL